MAMKSKRNAFRIQRLMKRMDADNRGWTIETVAKRLGVSFVRYQQIETGKMQPTPAEIEKLAGIFGVAKSVLTADESVTA